MHWLIKDLIETNNGVGIIDVRITFEMFLRSRLGF